MFCVTPGQPALLFAPMQGVTDAPMRQVLSELGVFSACVAEYVRVSQVVPPVQTYCQLVPELGSGGCTAGGTPVVVQLLGGDPALMAASAQRAAALGAQAIDLNFGCPARTVNRHDGGATLLKEPDRLYRIVSAVRAAVPAHIAVSAKLRLGWEDPQDIFETSAAAAEGGASWLTVHGRTRVQGYQPYALWEPIAQLKARLTIPVVVNGDLFDAEHLARARAITGGEHFMVGRGAIANPQQLLFMAALLQPAAHQNTQPDELFQTAAQVRRALMLRYVRIARQTSDKDAERFLPGRLKQWGLLAKQHAKETFYDDIKRLKTVEEIAQAWSY